MPILDVHTLDFISNSPSQTRRFGARLGLLLQSGDVVGLEGELGTGKTCFIQGVGQGMGITETITSPTFTLAAEYQAPSSAPTLHHLDMYRLDTPMEEAMAFGLDEYLQGDGACVVEWAERVRPAFPEEHLWIRLRYLGESKRGIMMTASGEHYDRLLAKFRAAAFGV